MSTGSDQSVPARTSRTVDSPAEEASASPPTSSQPPVDSSHTAASPPHTIARRTDSRRPADFSELAARLRGRAVDLLAIGLLAAIIVGAGRQATRWWNDDPADSSTATPLAEPVFPLFGGDGQPVTIEFGRRKMSLSRRTYAGSRSSAVEQLATLCLERTLKAPLPAGPPDSAEQRMLKLLASQQPWDALPGQWQVFLTEGPVTLAVGLRHTAAAGPGMSRGTESTSKNAARSSSPPSGIAANAPWRVVATAMVFPAGDGRWTIYETDPPGANPGGSTARQPASPAADNLRERLLPAAAELLLSLTDAAGSSVTSFRIPAATPEDLPQLQQLFDSAARQEQGQVLQSWHHGASDGASATATPLTATAAWRVEAHGTQCRWEVRLTVEAARRGFTGWAGLLVPGSGEQPARPAEQ